MRFPSVRRWRVWLGLGLAGWACGCNSQDADRLAQVGRVAAARVERLTGGARGKLAGGWQAVRGSLSEATLDSRVATRLRWDQALADADIQVAAQGRGVVQLQGTVANPEQRRRAVELAQTTLGVEQVLDALTLSGEAPGEE